MPIPDRKQIKQDLLVLLSTRKEVLIKDVYRYLENLWQITNDDKEIIRGKNLLYQHEIRWAKQELEYESQEEHQTFIEGKSIRIFVNIY